MHGFKIYLENTNQEEIVFLRDIIISLPNLDTSTALIFCDWLEDNNRMESRWLRSIVQRDQKNNKIIDKGRMYNAYTNGASMSRASSSVMTVLRDVPNIKEEELPKLREFWEPILRSFLVFTGSKVEKAIHNGIGHLMFHPKLCLWWQHHRGEFFPMQIIEDVPPSMYWMALMLILPLQGWKV